jgi:hypothetical protein
MLIQKNLDAKEGDKVHTSHSSHPGEVSHGHRPASRKAVNALCPQNCQTTEHRVGILVGCVP